MWDAKANYYAANNLHKWLAEPHVRKFHHQLSSYWSSICICLLYNVHYLDPLLFLKTRIGYSVGQGFVSRKANGNMRGRVQGKVRLLPRISCWNFCTLLYMYICWCLTSTMEFSSLLSLSRGSKWSLSSKSIRSVLPDLNAIPTGVSPCRALTVWNNKQNLMKKYQQQGVSTKHLVFVVWYYQAQCTGSAQAERERWVGVTERMTVITVVAGYRKP